MWDELSLVAIGFFIGIGVSFVIQAPLRRWLLHDRQADRKRDKARIMIFLRDWNYGSVLTTQKISQGAFASEVAPQYVYELLMELREEGRVKAVASKLDSPISTGWMYVRHPDSTTGRAGERHVSRVWGGPSSSGLPNSPGEGGCGLGPYQ